MQRSTALPIAWLSVRAIIVLNWVLGACILGLLIYTFLNPAWTMKALGISGLADSSPVMRAMQAVAVLGLVAIPLNYMILTRLLRMIESVRAGDPFVAANAERLNRIAWLLLAIQLLSMVIGAIGKAISTPAHPFHLSAGFSVNGWLAVILTFVLASVFAQGAVMREELEGTV